MVICAGSFFGARDEHTISSVLSRTTVSASTVVIGLVGGGPSGLFHFGIVDTLEVDGFYARYEGDGRRNSPYDPRMLLKVQVYAYASGVFSSRKSVDCGVVAARAGGRRSRG